MTPEARPTSAVARTGSVAAASFVQNAIAFVATAYVSRLLGPAGRGMYYLPILTATTVLAFCKLGVDQANVYLLATRRIPMRSLSAQNSLLALTMGLVGVAATGLLPSVWPSLVAPSSRWLLLTASLMIPLGIHTQLSAGLLSLAGKPAVQYHAATVGALAQIVLLAAVAAATGLSPDRAVAIAVVGTALTWAVLTVRIGRLVPVSPGFDGPLLRDTLRISFPLYVSSLLLLLHLRVDMFMVSLWSGARALGLYSVAVVLAETLMLANESVALGILPEQVDVPVRDAALRAFGGVRAMVAIGLALSIAWVARRLAIDPAGVWRRLHAGVRRAGRAPARHRNARPATDVQRTDPANRTPVAVRGNCRRVAAL